MPDPGSVTGLLELLKEGRAEAVRPLWERYYGQFVRLARGLRHAGKLPGADADDVVSAAFESFFRGVERDSFRRLENRDDLWQLLLMLTRRKALDFALRERRAKRGAGKVRHFTDLAAEADVAEVEFSLLLSREPTPDVAAEVADECRRLLGLLPGRDLRDVALWKLEGYSNAEVAAKIGRSVVTVERKLRRIRSIWEGAL